ncbi:glycine--tRNA ligase subunit beta [Thiopseudomonas denitrificans]|uniref:Glycine--tRNA ligase beta subunit n=1 Tax=Thiopseudomonas denitrificans TaxID=1501432 RepID=A0A4R6TY18_9GAMM|nr:glycine--tRNA ligase subunit beta [Thiopseudomonas denitrificans]TDQ38216.1 glycyl-tRNA synthetase beta chain [Thiopseudomonas denitrificans]
MSTQDFLVELGTEELPPKALKTLAKAFTDGIVAGLKAAGLPHGKVHSYAAPRRLAVLVEQLAERQADREQAMDGPPVQAAFDANGNPTQAALGFARRCGVELDAIDRSGAKLRFVQQIAGQATAELLPGIVEQSLDKLPIPKRMRWGARREEFVRPTQWLVMLLGEQVVDCTLLAQTAGRESMGHRFHHNQPVSIQRPTDYLEALRSAKVLADFDERRELIASKVTELAAKENGKAIMPADLLDEVASLVEWPVPLVCSFEEHFLQVPQEALIATMQDDQRYFCLVDGEGKLLPRFITVANLESKDPAQVVSGNEKVVRPRLSDAEFFYLQDQKQSLESFNELLKNVVFQAELGTVYEKAERVSALAAQIATQIGGNAEHAARAGILSKCDLATAMVGEYPEMQGIAGYYYAQLNNEPGDVPAALNEQYMPRGAGAELPATLTGAAVAVADKIDTLVGIFGVGMLPTGSRDPYALRRAALGVLRILIEKELEQPLTPLLQAAIDQYGSRVKADGLLAQVHDFIFDRLRARYEDAGIEVSVYQAVRAVHPDSPLDFDQRVQAVQHFRSLSEAEALAAANKRVSNVLGDAEDGQVQESLLAEPAEKALFAALQQAQQDVAPLAAAHDYTGILTRLAQLQQPVDAFFDDVMVNAEDSAIRANRHALLAQLRGLFLSVADISLLG